MHAKRELSEYGRSPAPKLLDWQYGQTSTRLLIVQLKHFYVPDLNIFSPFSGLHYASFFGISKVVASLIEMECHDTNEGDFSGRGPLTWAARNGHEGVVKILFGRGDINPDKPDDGDRIPLPHATSYGHEGVVNATRAGRGQPRQARYIGRNTAHVCSF